MQRASSLSDEMLNRMSIHPSDAAGRYELTGMTGSMCYMVRSRPCPGGLIHLGAPPQAPEVYKGTRYNEKVDIYSLGVIMYVADYFCYSSFCESLLTAHEYLSTCITTPLFLLQV